MADGRVFVLLAIVIFVWILCFWGHRQTFPFGQVYIGTYLSRIFGGKAGYVAWQFLSYQLGASAMFIVDTLLRALNITDNFGISVAVAGIVIVISQQLLKRKAERQQK